MVASIEKHMTSCIGLVCVVIGVVCTFNIERCSISIYIYCKSKYIEHIEQCVRMYSIVATHICTVCVHNMFARKALCGNSYLNWTSPRMRTQLGKGNISINTHSIGTINGLNKYVQRPRGSRDNSVWIRNKSIGPCLEQLRIQKPNRNETIA